MKVVILAAARARAIRGSGSKPKCLFHHRGEVLLDRQLRVFHALGIKDIRIVVDYKREMIEDFNREHNLGLKLIHSPDSAFDRYVKGTSKVGRGYLKNMQSLKLGLEGIDDDVIIIYGDVYLNLADMKRVLSYDCCVSVWGRGDPKLKFIPHGKSIHLFKITKEKLPLIDFNAKGVGWTMHFFCLENGGIEIMTGIYDIDKNAYIDEYHINYLFTYNVTPLVEEPDL